MSNETEPFLEQALKTIGGLSVAAKALGAPIGWQPIETAPRDGTPFLAFQTEERGPFKCWMHDDWTHAEHYWMDPQDSEPDPAYWMPLPAAPTP